MLALLTVASLAVLLLSNLWLLREVERLRDRVDVYQREVLNLDAQLSRVTVQVQLLREMVSGGDAALGSEQTPG